MNVVLVNLGLISLVQQLLLISRFVALKPHFVRENVPSQLKGDFSVWS